MIIQCEQCKTKFRLDDSKVSDKGVKVRCAKCRHVFTVVKEQSESASQSDFDSLLDQKNMRDEPASAAIAAAAQGMEPDTAPAPPEPDTGFSGFDFASNDPFAEAGAATPAAEEAKDEPASAAADDTGFSGFDFASHDPFAEAGAATPAAGENKDELASATADDAGFSGFDFASHDPFAETGAATPAAGESKDEPASTAVDDTGFSGFDFASDDPFAEAGAATPVAEVTKDESAFAAADDTGFYGFDLDSANPFADQQKSAAQEPAVPDSSIGQGAADDFSAFDFNAVMPGEEFSVAKKEIDRQEEGVSGDYAEKPNDFFDFNDLKPAEPAPVDNAGGNRDESSAAGSAIPPQPKAAAVSFARPEQAVAEPKPFFGDNSSIAPATPQEEFPPLSISSRRRQSSLITGAIAVAGVIGASLAAFYGYTYFAQDKGKSVSDTEKIVIRTVDASFVKNQSAGELLVITGEAQNNFKKARAAIQVKGMVYGPNGQVLASKNAYAGNQLTREQLATLSLDKIEAAMANQFGDSLSNLGVAPAKTIPFVVVIPAPPADAKDYGVEPAGSTVATGKQ